MVLISLTSSTRWVPRSFAFFAKGRVPLDKREGSVKGKVILCSAEAPLRLPEKVEDQGSGNLTLNHFSVEDRSTNHRFGLYIDHDSSMRTSRRRAGAKVENVFCFPRRVFCAVFCTGPFRDARAPNQSSGLARADQGHPRAALDANDLWIRFLGAEHPVESYR